MSDTQATPVDPQAETDTRGTAVAGPALSRAGWDQVISNNRFTPRAAPGAFGVADFDALTGLETHKSGLSDEDVERSNRGFPPNPALYPQGILVGPGSRMVNTDPDGAWAQFAHMSRTLNQRGPDAVKMIREAGSIGVQKSFEASEPGAIASNSPYKGYTVVAQTTGEAQMTRALVDYASHYVRPNGVHGDMREVRTPDDLPPAESIKSFLAGVRPPREIKDPIIALVTSAWQKDQSYDVGAETIKILLANEKLRGARYLVPENQIFQDRVKKAGLNVIDDPSVVVAKGTGKAWVEARQEAIKRATNKADYTFVAFRPTAYTNDAVQTAAMRAAATGQLIGYAEGNQAGLTVVPLAEADRKLAMDQNSLAQMRTQEAISRSDLRLDGTEGRMAIRLLATADRTSFPNAREEDGLLAMQVAQKHGAASVGDIYRMMHNPSDHKELMADGFPMNMVRRMHDGNLVRDMLENSTRQQGQLNKYNTQEVNGAEFNRPSLFVQGDAQLLDSKKVALVGGLPATEVAGRVAEATQKAGAVPVFVEGHGAPTSPDQVPAGAILVVNSGVAFQRTMPDLAWTVDTGKFEPRVVGSREVRTQEYYMEPKEGVAERKDGDIQAMGSLAEASKAAKSGPFQGLVGGSEREQVQTVDKVISLRQTPEVHSSRGSTGTYQVIYNERMADQPEGTPLSLQLRHINAAGEVREISQVNDLPARYSRDEAERTRNTRDWDRAAANLRMQASFDATKELTDKTPESIAQKEVRAAFAEKGLVVSLTPPMTDRVAWNADLMGYRPVPADPHEHTQKAALAFAITHSDRTVIVQEPNGVGSKLGQVLDIAAEAKKPMPAVVMPDKNDPDLGKYLGNGTLGMIPANTLASKVLSLDTTMATHVANAYGGSKAERLPISAIDQAMEKVVAPKRRQQERE